MHLRARICDISVHHPALQEPHPADDLNGADVARKLTILSRFIPSLRTALPNGYLSVSTKSLVPPELEGIASGDEFIKRLPEFDTRFDQMRADAAREGQVLRFAGVVDVKTGVIKADLEKYATASCLHPGHRRLCPLTDTPSHIRLRLRWEGPTT